VNNSTCFSEFFHLLENSRKNLERAYAFLYRTGRIKKFERLKILLFELNFLRLEYSNCWGYIRTESGKMDERRLIELANLSSKLSESILVNCFSGNFREVYSTLQELQKVIDEIEKAMVA